MWKWTKSDLSDLEKDLYIFIYLLERFKQALSGKLYARIEKKLLKSFEANCLQVQKGPNLTFLTLKNYI